MLCIIYIYIFFKIVYRDDITVYIINRTLITELIEIFGE